MTRDLIRHVLPVCCLAVLLSAQALRAETEAAASCGFELPSWYGRRSPHFETLTPPETKAGFLQWFVFNARGLAEDESALCAAVEKNGGAAALVLLDMASMIAAGCRGRAINPPFWASAWRYPTGIDRIERAGGEFCRRVDDSARRLDNRIGERGSDVLELYNHLRWIKAEWFCLDIQHAVDPGGAKGLMLATAPGIDDLRASTNDLCNEVHAGRLSIRDGYYRFEKTLGDWHRRIPESTAARLGDYFKWVIELVTPDPF